MIHQEIEFEVTRDVATSVRIELPPIEARVELRVHWDRQPAGELGVSLRGHPDSLRYSGQGLSRLTLALGSHEILIGAGDRVEQSSQDTRSGCLEGLPELGFGPAIAALDYG